MLFNVFFGSPEASKTLHVFTIHCTHSRTHTHTHSHICRQSDSDGTLLMGLFLMSQEEESDPSKVNISISLCILLCANVCPHAIHTHTFERAGTQVLVNLYQVVVFISNCF